MAVIEQDIALTTKDTGGNSVLLYPVTKVGNVDGAVSSVNGTAPDSAGNVKINIPTINNIGNARSRASGKYNYGQS